MLIRSVFPDVFGAGADWQPVKKTTAAVKKMRIGVRKILILHGEEELDVVIGLFKPTQQEVHRI